MSQYSWETSGVNLLRRWGNRGSGRLDYLPEAHKKHPTWNSRPNVSDFWNTFFKHEVCCFPTVDAHLARQDCSSWRSAEWGLWGPGHELESCPAASNSGYLGKLLDFFEPYFPPFQKKTPDNCVWGERKKPKSKADPQSGQVELGQLNEKRDLGQEGLEFDFGNAELNT